MRDSQLTREIIGAAMEVDRALGPGLPESAYEEPLARELTLRNAPFDRQKPVPLVYRELKLECGYRLDFLVAGRIVVEIKATQAIAPTHESIMLTYLRLSGSHLGLLIHFHAPILKDGIRRFVWQYAGNDNAETPSTQRNAEDAAKEN